MFIKLRKSFMLILVISSMVVLTSADPSIAKKNLPGGIVWDVYPSMSRGDIQAVVDSASDGDTVYFHAGTYDWSSTPLAGRLENTGAINIVDKTLTIKGEEGTLIVGPESEAPPEEPMGVSAFNVTDLDTDNDVTFDGLGFQTFLRGINCRYVTDFQEEIVVPNARNLTVKNCTFSDIYRDAISISHIGGDVLIQNNDIAANRFGLLLCWYWSEGHTAWQPEDTYIRFLENNVTSQIEGIYLNQTTNVIIKHNTIEGEDRGIYIIGTREGAVISDNSLFNCNNGIDIRGVFRDGEEYEAEGAVVEKNELINIRDLGIILRGDACYGHTISSNRIQMAPGSYAGIFTRANDNYYGQNKISGAGLCAFWLDRSNDFDDTAAYYETFQANNINQFSPDFCHFLLHEETHDNLIVGSGMGHNTYVDWGYNNRITGVTPMTGGIGQELNEAIKKRNEELEEARKVKF